MPAEFEKRYLGELATPGEIRLLADGYRKAAYLLQQLGRTGALCPGRPSGYRPFTQSNFT